MAQTPEAVTRKPSGSSSQTGQSPMGSPNNPQRKLASSGASMLGVAAGGSGLKPSNGWQAWPPGSPANQRNTSGSSGASASDLPSTHGDGSHRGNYGEGWSSRPSSGNWDDANSAQQPFGARHGRPGQQNTALAVARTDAPSAHSHTRQISPSRYNLPGQRDQPRFPTVENELVAGLRGMAIGDDPANFNAGGFRQPGVPPQPSASNALHQPPRPPFNNYTGPFYPNPGEYHYGYNAPDPAFYSSMPAPSPSTMYPTISPQLMHAGPVGQPTMQYDFSGQPPPQGPFFYPSQSMPFAGPSHSPMVTPQLPHATPATLSDKKREMQFTIQHNINTQVNPYSGMRTSPSPHTQPYGAGLDYGGQVPLMTHGPMFAGPPGPNSGHYPSGAHPRALLAQLPTGHRSALLDEFRANKNRRWELRDILNNVVEFAADQHGSRFLQEKLDHATPDEAQIVFDAIIPGHALGLMQDVFGNYVVQKLLDHGASIQRSLIVSCMRGNVLTLSTQMYACRVVQKAIECISPEEQVIIVQELEAHVLRCVKDANGNHVVQKLIERVSPERLGFVNTFRGNVYDLATHPYGCRVLQRCFEHLPEALSRALLDELHRYAPNLMQDQFGNYVIQFIFVKGKAQDRALAYQKLQGRMLQMSRHKFASNVVERAIETADAETRRRLIEEIMTPKQDGSSPVAAMMKDQFANYVLQKALDCAEPEQREALADKVRPLLLNMRRYNGAHSKHLVQIERKVAKVPAPQARATAIN